MSKETIKLFNSEVCYGNSYSKTAEDIKRYNKTTIQSGYIIDPKIYHSRSNEDIQLLFDEIEKHIRISYMSWNRSFYKSWSTVASKIDTEFLIDQLLHYLTTYGFEAMGIDSPFVYIPEGETILPELNNVSFLYIKGITEKELKEKLKTLVGSGMALKDETLLSICEVIERYFILDTKYEIFEACNNKELRIRMIDMMGLTPADPFELLRYICYKSTDGNSSLLIQDSYTIEKVKEASAVHNFYNTIFSYISYHGEKSLAEVFYRFKPLFLALRNDHRLKTQINRIRKLAKKYHKPIKEDYLNSLTETLRKQKPIDFMLLHKELENKNIFRKARLLYALKYLQGGYSEKIYQIRNGSTYVKDEPEVIDWAENTILSKVIFMVENSIVQSLSKNVFGKTIIIPSMMNYALPSTEKQFIGNIPAKSYVQWEDKDIVVGVHWTNTEDQRVDLDLSNVSINGKKYGWDGYYRNSDQTVLFSGDLTDAPIEEGGASEFFYFRRKQKASYLTTVNFYNYDSVLENIPFSIAIAKAEKGNMSKDYMIDPNHIVVQTESEVGQRQKSLGVTVIEDNKRTFYFMETRTDKIVSIRSNEETRICQQYMLNQLEITVNLNELLKKAGANVVCNLPEKAEEEFIDLRPESLDKNSFLKIFQ